MSNYVNLLDIVYPVGAVYISNNATSPSNIVGGTWTEVASDTFICAGTPNTTGGKNAFYLAEGQIPTTFWSSSNLGYGGYKPSIKGLFSLDKGVYGICCTPGQGNDLGVYAQNMVNNRPQYRQFKVYFRTA